LSDIWIRALSWQIVTIWTKQIEWNWERRILAPNQSPELQNRRISLISFRRSNYWNARIPHFSNSHDLSVMGSQYISPIHTFVNIPALLLKNTLRFLIKAGIFTKVWIGDICPFELRSLQLRGSICIIPRSKSSK
jgi:hypothetical protein